MEKDGITHTALGGQVTNRSAPLVMPPERLAHAGV